MSETTVPRHVGLILDGNRRWAKSQGLPSLEGHRRGFENLWDIAKAFFDRNVQTVSAYVFSTENWSRSEKEVSYLMKLVTHVLNSYLEDAQKNEVKITILGSREKLSKSVLQAIEKAESATKDNTRATLALCFNYGGRQEIVDAVKYIVEAGIDPDCIDAEYFDQYLYGDTSINDVDLVVRTSGEQRLSGFMTWRTVYSELLFIDKHWPDFTVEDVDMVIGEYANRQRRFGK